jgi:murein DD-endopeptidase MepM/ murein hydrolase activator NlpD
VPALALGALGSGCAGDDRPDYHMPSGGKAAAGDTSEPEDGSGGKPPSSDGGSFGPGGASAESGGSSSASGGSASGGKPSGGSSDCNEEKCLFEWPLEGEAADDWIIANYVDRSPGGGLLDYRGGTSTYENHQGVDIAIASFRTMDAGVAAYAVAPGIVSAVHDGESDRNTVADPGNCSLVANSVYVTHPDGRQSRYLHFKKGSIQVTLGQEIQAGQKLGLIGSSGCSQSPHLHFELRDGPNDAVLDPFFEELWLDPPAYDVAPGVMEIVVRSGSFSSTNDVQLAPPSPLPLPAGDFGISVISGGTSIGETEQVRLYQGDALEAVLAPYVFDGSERLYMRWWNTDLSAGSYRAEISLGNQVVDSVSFEVE